MPNNEQYTVSQDYEILLPKKSKSYPISIDDWQFLKTKIEKITVKQNWYYNISFTLFGGALSFLGTNLTTNNSTNTQIICWAIFAVCLFCGFVLLFFGKGQNKNQSEIADEIITQMENIEKRYEQC